MTRMPVNRELTSWWECAAEDRNTYTQAQCRTLLAPEDEESTLGRIRYDPEQNLNFYGVAFSDGDFKWHEAGKFSLAGAVDAIVSATAWTALAITTLSIAF